MSLPQIRDEHRVPARLGARVTVHPPFAEPADGTVIGSHDGWIYVRRDDGRDTLAYPHELTWKG